VRWPARCPAYRWAPVRPSPRRPRRASCSRPTQGFPSLTAASTTTVRLFVILLASATRVEEPETHIKRQATRHDCLPRLDEPNEPTKEEPLSLVLYKSPFLSVLTVSKGHPSLVSMGRSKRCGVECLPVVLSSILVRHPGGGGGLFAEQQG
jgi:hypothetical protein